jgi:hypothetical protein
MTREHFPDRRGSMTFEFDSARMTPEQFRKTIELLGLTLSTAAALLSVHARTTRRWANDEREIPGPVCQFLRYLVMQKAIGHRVVKPRAKKIKTNETPKLNAIGKPYGANFDPHYRFSYRGQRKPSRWMSKFPEVTPERWEVMCRQAQAAWDSKMAAESSDRRRGAAP